MLRSRIRRLFGARTREFAEYNPARHMACSHIPISRASSTGRCNLVHSEGPRVYKGVHPGGQNGNRSLGQERDLTSDNFEVVYL